ncbi:MAG TPA: hypothetical protein PKU97_00230 [Kofleriaceae bacterium]|nr:hypothetical protein [Kofleriaceae bacterium]
MAAPSVSPPAATSEGAYLTLTSDLLLRDDLLRWRTALPDREMLAKVPGWPSAAITVTRCHEEESAVNGFNGTARLWRTPATAIRRGSVYKIKGEGVAALALAAAQGQALGERVHEGLGRFRVDARLPGVANADGIDAGPAPPPHVVAPPRSARAAQPAQAVTAEQICCVTKEWRLAALAAKSTSEDRKPSLSQWHDLVAELEAAPPGDPGKAQRAAVIRNRQESNTAGARPWRHQDASYVLGELSKVPSARQPAYARMFVRWLRVQVRQPSQKGS